MRRLIVCALLLAAATFADAATLHEKIDRTFDVGAGATLSVSNTNGTITVTGWDQPRIRVVAVKTVDRTDSADAKAAMAQLRVDMVQRGNSLTVRTEQPKAHAGLWDLLFGNFHDASVTYEIYVPRSLKLELDDTNGALHVTNVQGVLKLETTNGGIELAHCGGSLNAETTNGRIEADLLSLDSAAKNSFETTNGRIELTLPAAIRVTLDAGTTNGRIESDLPVATRSKGSDSLRGAINGGGAALTLQTTNGGIRIHSTPPAVAAR